MTTAQAREQLIENGYLVVPEVVPSSLCEAVIDAIDAFRETWDHGSKPNELGIVPLHHHPALWAVRQHPGLYDVFRAIYGRDDLWVTMDRAGYKPAHDHEGQGAVHWDCDPWTQREFGVQGLVYLTDTATDQGAFACVPSIYRNLDDWCEAHEHDPNRRHPDIGEHELVRVPGSAGSLVLFHRLMPHTNTVNTSDKPRYAQYVSMHPAGVAETPEEREKNWRDCLPPAWAIRQQVPNQVIPEPWGAAPLTALGRKLVGVEGWDGTLQ